MKRAVKVQLLAVMGMVIAAYALTVEAHMYEEDYTAACDFAASFSCTEVFKSAYAHPLSHWGLVPKDSDLDLGLAAAGILLYSAYFVAACLWDVIPAGFRKTLFLTVAVAGGCFSCYLLYVLKFILGDFCIVCTGFHTVNFAMLAVAIFEYRDRPSSDAAKKKL
jgi:vitamin-K-epoxide reductase (warfarin-sensitive)